MLAHILDSKNPQMLRPAAAVPLTASRRLFLKASAAAGAGWADRLLTRLPD